MSIFNFNPEAYWASREFKTWVVFLQKKSRQKKSASDKKIVRARTRAGAVKTAKANSFLKGCVASSVSLATPFDLGCVEMKA